MMRLQHIALVSGSEYDCDRFYLEVLGLEKKESKTLSSRIAQQIFGIAQDYRIVNYGNHGINFEIFIAEKSHPEYKTMEHICLEVDDRNLFIQKCSRMNIEVSEIPRGEFTLVFIKDYDGNLFEIKEKNR